MARRRSAADAARPSPTHTDFEREAYEMLRGRDLPMACYAGGAETSQCLVIDPLSHAPAMIVAYGP